MTSLKGVVIGSPEYVRIAKQAEREGEATVLIAEIEDKLDQLAELSGDLMGKHQVKLRRIRQDISNITDGW